MDNLYLNTIRISIKAKKYKNGIRSQIALDEINKIKMEITHWHPDEYEIYDEICKIGEKGNVLVIKTFLGSACVVYMGAKNECPIKKNKFRFCKLYYFESK